MNLADLSPSELVDLIVARADDRGRLRMLAQQEHKKLSKPARWAVATKAAQAVEETVQELLRRLGAERDARTLSRAGLIFYSRSKVGRACAGCKVKPWGGRGMHWWTSHGFPLAFIHATSKTLDPATVVENIKFAISVSDPLCGSCAAHRHNAKFTNRREPNLKHYKERTDE